MSCQFVPPQSGSTTITHVDAAGQRRIRKPHLELELVIAIFEPPVTADDCLVFEKCCEAITKVLGSALASSAFTETIVVGSKPIGRGSAGIFVHLDEPVQADNYVRNPCRLADLDDYAPSHDISWRIPLVWILGLHKELGNGASF